MKDDLSCAIITIHFGVNYGSALQAYAMSEIMKIYCGSVTVINYIPERYSFKNKYFKHKNLLGLIKCLIVFPFRAKYQIVFKRFLQQRIALTKCCSRITDITTNTGNKSIYIAGSDQIWNSNYNKGVDPAYYLDFAPTESVKIAYAASFGKSKLNDNELEETKTLLNNFNYISVREENAVEILESLGIHDSIHVLDPTFLLDKNEWLLRFGTVKKIEPYLLVYALDNDEASLVKIGKQIANRFKLKVRLICFGYYKMNIDGLDECLIYKSPDVFVQEMLGAAYVVTNSFHGLAFSINLNKQFIAVRRKEYNSRLESLLHIFGLERRLIDKSKGFEITLVENLIDYSHINEIINIERKKASRFISNSFIESN